MQAYGADMPLNQVATITVPEPRMITVQVWDRGLVQAVEQAIRDSGLGLNPVTDGQLIRVPIPALTEERRHELDQDRRTTTPSRHGSPCATCGATAWRTEEGREGRRASRRTSTALWTKQVQDLTDQHIKRVDDVLAKKDSGDPAGLSRCKRSDRTRCGAAAVHVAIIMDGNGRWATGAGTAAHRRPPARRARRCGGRSEAPSNSASPT